MKGIIFAGGKEKRRFSDWVSCLVGDMFEIIFRLFPIEVEISQDKEEAVMMLRNAEPRYKVKEELRAIRYNSGDATLIDVSEAIETSYTDYSSQDGMHNLNNVEDPSNNLERSSKAPNVVLWRGRWVDLERTLGKVVTGGTFESKATTLKYAWKTVLKFLWAFEEESGVVSTAADEESQTLRLEPSDSAQVLYANLASLFGKHAEIDKNAPPEMEDVCDYFAKSTLSLLKFVLVPEYDADIATRDANARLVVRYVENVNRRIFKGDTKRQAQFRHAFLTKAIKHISNTHAGHFATIFKSRFNTPQDEASHKLLLKTLTTPLHILHEQHSPQVETAINHIINSLLAPKQSI